MFNSKLRKKIENLEKINKNNEEIISCQKRIIELLNNEISRRDLKIAELQKKANIPDPFAFDFPGTEKSFDDFWAKFAGPKNKES